MKREYRNLKFKRKPLFNSDKKETEYLVKLQDEENFVEYRKHIMNYMEDRLHINWSYEKLFLVLFFISIIFVIFVRDMNFIKYIGFAIGIVSIGLAIFFHEKNKKVVWEYALVDAITKDLANNK